MTNFNFILLVILICLGIANALYLVISRYKKKPIACPITHQCNEVIRSKWSRIFYINNDATGLLFYVFLLFGIIFTKIIENNILSLLINLSVTLALLFSIFLTAIQLFVLRKRCFYCLASALINLLIFLIIILD